MPQPPFITGLLEPAAYPHPAETVRLIETHISWVLLAGAYAYKIKKPLDLGFLDFSTPELRRHYCEEEIRLNRRLAPDIYLGVSRITGTPEAPRINGHGAAFEHAVRMWAFPADATLDRATCLEPGQIDAIAERVARFHAEVDRAPASDGYGSTAMVMQPVRENFTHLRRLDHNAETGRRLDLLDAWSEDMGRRLAGRFHERAQQGFIRECHGDLHLGNIAWQDGRPLIFDCIEFNPGLRFIDVFSEIAFLFMDLASRGLDDLAWRFLNRYLEHSGDYRGLDVFRFYLVYRALVRAKVAGIRAAQAGGTDTELCAYLALAERLALPGHPALLLMHGVSGSGKTWLSQHILEQLGCIRLRSDVERKRLFGLGRDAASGSGLDTGIYTAEATARTFQAMAEDTAAVLDAGFPVIVDATFLKRPAREQFHQMAKARKTPFRILDMQANECVLRERIGQRNGGQGDASEATLEVLQAQLDQQEPLQSGELAETLVFDYAKQDAWEARIESLAADVGIGAGR